MQIVRESIALRDMVAGWRSAGERIALVPTMGALHDGHLALVAEGKRHAERVVATIFVNPLQFNQAADLERYPRTEEADVAALEAAGCDSVWLPSGAEIYPPGFATNVSVRGLSDRWEGEFRPGHFDGMATVVTKFLVSARPNFAIFGEKDWQQLAIVRQLARDLGIDTQIIGYPTVREADGLAMSSRNRLLSADERARAVALPEALGEARAAIESSEHILVSTLLAVARAKLAGAGFESVDYLALVDADTLEPLDHAHGTMRLIAAATIGETRLIDNISVEMDTVG
ncbi:MAG: pantoate--beta-alanine ligase [Sphingomicrobium sp.]